MLNLGRCWQKSSNNLSSAAPRLQTARRTTPLSLSDDRTFVDEQAAAKLRHLGFNLITVPYQADKHMVLYLAYLIFGTD